MNSKLNSKSVTDSNVRDFALADLAYQSHCPDSLLPSLEPLSIIIIKLTYSVTEQSGRVQGLCKCGGGSGHGLSVPNKPCFRGRKATLKQTSAK